MIVSEKNVSTALAYLADDPHPLARARYELTNAENKSRETFARLYLAAGGSVEARKATAEIAPEYIETKKTEAEAQLEYERHRSRVKAADMLLEIWRSEQANVRAAEKIR
jgi:DNA-dependent RNA polymerase auxiliary subunit epsilon